MTWKHFSKQNPTTQLVRLLFGGIFYLTFKSQIVLMNLHKKYKTFKSTQMKKRKTDSGEKPKKSGRPLFPSACFLFIFVLTLEHPNTSVYHQV